MALVVMFLECDHLSLETCVLSEERGFLDISKKTILPQGDWLVGCCAVVVVVVQSCVLHKCDGEHLSLVLHEFMYMFLLSRFQISFIRSHLSFFGIGTDVFLEACSWNWSRAYGMMTTVTAWQ